MHPSRDSGGMSARAMWRLWSEEMSLPMGRGTERVRSCGLVRKRDNAGRQMERFEVLGTCIIGGISTVYNKRSTAQPAGASIGKPRRCVNHDKPRHDTNRVIILWVCAILGERERWIPPCGITSR